MQGGYFSYALLTALATALLIAAVTDLRRREIDNWLTGAIALGAPLFWLASGVSLLEAGYQMALALLLFLVLFALFAIRSMGGGDVKLLTALALWIRPRWFLKLLFVMSIVGGILTLAFVAWHFLRRRKEKIAIPYGVAISIGGLWTLANQYFPALANATSLG